MPPPQQGFGSHYGAVRKPDLRLKIKFELLACKSSSQLRIESASRLRLGAKHRLEMTAHATAAGLCLIEGKIGVRDQVIDIEPIVRSDSDACAAADVERVIADLEWPGEMVEHGADKLVDQTRIAAIWYHDDELIPAEAEHPRHLPRLSPTCVNRCPISTSN